MKIPSFKHDVSLSKHYVSLLFNMMNNTGQHHKITTPPFPVKMTLSKGHDILYLVYDFLYLLLMIGVY